MIFFKFINQINHNLILTKLFNNIIHINDIPYKLINIKM